MHDLVRRARGSLLGLAVGDALGTTVEFKRRGSFAPVTDLVGGGAFRLAPGQWTDDTSMALCLARSLLDRQGFDAVDQLQRYTRWWRQGYLSATGACFDIGGTTATALGRFEETGEARCGEPRGGGNGSLMRLAPVALYYAQDAEAAVRHAGESSLTTHGAPEATDACRLYASLLVAALHGAGRDEVLFGARPGLPVETLHPRVRALAEGSFRDQAEADIRSNGYVLHSLEAALWCVHRTADFREAVLLAANLGDDADTTAAIVGQLAGALYGEDGIPAEWRARVQWGPRIAHLGEALARAGTHAPAPFPRSYWALPGTLLGGPYPMGKDDADPAHKVRGLLDAGVRTFVNLMEEGEVDHDGEPFRPYEPLVAEEALRRGVSVTCLRFPIVDVSVPTTAQMGVIQAALDESLARGDTVYVHCWGGRGRTGTVVGAFLVRHGFAEPDDFVDAIAARRGPEAVGPSPETPAQERFVRNYLGAAQAQGR